VVTLAGRWEWRTWKCRTWNWRTNLQGMKQYGNFMSAVLMSCNFDGPSFWCSSFQVNRRHWPAVVNWGDVDQEQVLAAFVQTRHRHSERRKHSPVYAAPPHSASYTQLNDNGNSQHAWRRGWGTGAGQSPHFLNFSMPENFPPQNLGLKISILGQNWNFLHCNLLCRICRCLSENCNFLPPQLFKGRRWPTDLG